MNFWSKGLGKKRIDLFLSRGETVQGRETLYVKGQMEAPVSWEYIIPMRGKDIEDFLDLLRDPAMADYVYHSPRRWKLIGAMVLGGLRVAGLVVLAVFAWMLGRESEAEAIELEVPPPSMRKKSKDRAARRRRLSTKRLEAPSADGKTEDDGPPTAAAG